MGAGMAAGRAAIVQSYGGGPLGVFDGPQQQQTIATNDQLLKPADYDPIVVRAASGSLVRLSAIASIAPGVRNTLSAAWFNGQPSVLLTITKQAEATPIQTLTHLHPALPSPQRPPPPHLPHSP